MNLSLNREDILDVLSVVGRARLLLLGAFLAVNMAFGALIYGYIIPDVANAQNEAIQTQGETQTLSADIRKLRLTFEELEQKRVLFAQVERQGFFSSQDRKSAEGQLIDAERLSGVTEADTKISAVKIIKDARAQKADHVIIESNITSEIESLDDPSVYRFLGLVQERLPGEVSINKFTVERTQGLNAQILRSIRSGANPPLVKGQVDLVWHTMVPSTSVVQAEDTQ